MQPCRNVCELPKCDWHCKEPQHCPAPLCKMVCEPPRNCPHTSYHQLLPPKWDNETAVQAFRAPALPLQQPINSHIMQSVSGRMNILMPWPDSARMTTTELVVTQPATTQAPTTEAPLVVETIPVTQPPTTAATTVAPTQLPVTTTIPPLPNYDMGLDGMDMPTAEEMKEQGEEVLKQNPNAVDSVQLLHRAAPTPDPDAGD